MIQSLMFFATLKGRIAVIGAIVLALVSFRAFDVHKQRGIGEQRAVAKMEKATGDAIEKSDRASVKSVNGRGVLNPRYRD